ncbi:MAG: hypothetical protein ACE5GX_13425 [Thermoanaerobaculia bacterium]
MRRAEDSGLLAHTTVADELGAPVMPERLYNRVAAPVDSAPAVRLGASVVALAPIDSDREVAPPPLGDSPIRAPAAIESAPPGSLIARRTENEFRELQASFLNDGG